MLESLPADAAPLGLGPQSSMQLPKSAAAARMASADISGWPEAPGCPLHSRVPLAGAGTDGAA